MTVTRRTEFREEVTWEPARLANVVTQYLGKPNRAADVFEVTVTKGRWTEPGKPPSYTLSVLFRFDSLGRPTNWTWSDVDPAGTRRIIREGTDLELLGFLEEHAPEVFA